MGVHGLWDLLAPVGRRVSVETLAGKKLAIDASIWMVQFMKAMRDEKGEMVRNAHLLGFFRRICKLLFLRTRPVFVFDGATPALKRRTVMKRRKNREKAQANVRKTAEKLLLNHLKAMRLKELADDIKNQMDEQKNDAKGKKPDQSNLVGNDSGKNDVSSINYNQEKLDEMLAASISAEEDGSLANISTLSAANPCDEDDDEGEEMILPDMLGEVDPAVLAALTPSLQLDILQKQKQNNDAKGKRILSDKAGSNSGGDDIVSSSCSQQKLDEMLAASLMEEERRRLTNNASTSTARYLIEEDGDINDDEDEDEDEEMILPAMDGGVDPSILASLPPSMQLDLLVQIRERLMAENRQKYQKVKKDPGKFSELQIQAYLKTVAFRREIDQVQKTAAGRGVGGVQTSRIASEANREFIFSSSFTGDKQVLASSRAETRGYEQQALDEHPSNVMHTAVSTSKAKTVTGEKPSGDRRVFDDNIETYVDERGRVRVSRVRAMGIRMTRDLQRNLDLMKEIEQERENVVNLESERNSAIPSTLSLKTVIRTSHDGAESIKRSEAKEDSVLKSDASIEISFEDDGDIKCLDGDDNIFARLVSENPIGLSSHNATPSGKLSSASDSDCDWEEGTIEAKNKTLSDDANLSIMPLFSEGYNCDDSEVEWEEGVCEITEHTASTVAETRKKMYSKGCLEEEGDLQEAIRRSLGDIEVQKSDYLMPQDGKELSGGNSCKGSRFSDPEDRTEEPLFSGDDGIQRNVSTCDIYDGVSVLGVSKSNDSTGRLLKSAIVCNPDDSRILVDTPCESHVGSPKQSMQGASKRAELSKESPHAESITTSGVQEVNVLSGGRLCTSDEVGAVLTSSDTCAKYNPQTSDVLRVDIPDASGVHDRKTAAEAELSCPLTNSALPLSEELMNDLTHGFDNKEKLAVKECDENCFQEIDCSLENSALKEKEYFQVEATEADLEEELRILGQERMDLGDEQRRLERNAESVSSEMYAECQELLQMFGIPYVIAPVEAEAQCAFMELANLVDGVVTDDSDVFLFGARSVYKNIFDDRKYVETYFMKDIESELGLTREKLIRMALLLGSDYTEGVSGIGIVNAVEVLNAFPEEGGLQEFRDWIESPDPTILGKFNTQTDSGAVKKGSRTTHDKVCSQSNMDEASASCENSSEAPEQNQSADQIQERRKIFMDTHRKVSKNWHIPSSFPSEVVISAYLFPEVDKSTEPFTWAKPDHFVLRKLCWEKFGWGSQKADELILPVLKEYDKRETQRRLEEFYTFNEQFAKFRSKRIKKAVKGITEKQFVELMDDAAPEVSGRKNKRKSRDNESKNDQSEKPPQGTEENMVGNQISYRKKLTPKRLRKRTKPGDATVSESLVSSDGRQGTKSRRAQMSINHRGRRGRGRTLGGGKRKESLTDEASEMSSSNDEEGDVHMRTQEGPVELRRSTRSRNHVDYTANDSETDDLDLSVDKGDKQWFDEEAARHDSPWVQDPCENAASGLGQEKQHNNENVTSEQGLDTDYLEKGGGFCPDSDDKDQEYFKTGGGFCSDEDETHPDGNSVHRRATTVVLENAHLSHSSSLGKAGADVSKPTMDDPPSAKLNDQLKSTTLLQENDTNSSRTIPMGALRSMPHLRRKRRKS